MTDINFNRNARLVGIVIGAAESKSVLLAELATRLPGNATTTSKFRRLQDFFCEVLLDFNAVAALLMGFVGKLTNEPLTLAMDRTNWEAAETTSIFWS